jgi:hypothetical protein
VGFREEGVLEIKGVLENGVGEFYNIEKGGVG